MTTAPDLDLMAEAGYRVYAAARNLRPWLELHAHERHRWIDAANHVATHRDAQAMDVRAAHHMGIDDVSWYGLTPPLQRVWERVTWAMWDAMVQAGSVSRPAPRHAHSVQVRP